MCISIEDYSNVLVFTSAETLVLYCAQGLLMCVSFQITMSVIRSLAKVNRKIEQEKHK